MDLRSGAGGKQRQAETVALVDSLGLHDLHQHFSLRRGGKRWTWSKEREGRRISSICDYILVEDRADVKVFWIKSPRFDSDHSMVQMTLRLQSVEEHRAYVRR